MPGQPDWQGSGGERLLDQAPPPGGSSSFSRGGQFNRFSPGQPVSVYSGSAGAWVNGTIEEIFAQTCVADGYTVPAGCVKVILQDGGLKYVMPEQVESTLRPQSSPATLPPQSGSGFRSAPPAPAPQPATIVTGQVIGGNNPAPSGRADVGAERLDARDRWNTYEIRLQEIFMEYDKDSSGALEVDEFRALLRDFNEGRDPTEQEYGFIMRLSDKDGDGRINLGELHYALRAWHSYRHLDESVLRLFAEFDFDESGRLDAEELGALLTAINGGKQVPQHEVQRVLQDADVLGDRAINRSELLGALAAWYGNVDRKDTDLPTLLREAIARTIKETDYVSVLDQGKEAMGHAAGMVKGLISGYAQVDDGTGRNTSAESVAPSNSPPWPPSMSAVQSSAGGTPAMDEDLARQPLAVRVVKASPLILSSLSKFCYIGFPFIFGWVMTSTGWQHRDNECPRNLDGILLWFGLLVLAFSALAYVSDANAVVGRIAILVILGVLNIVGLLWTMDSSVQSNVGQCGRMLVWFSSFVWIAVPICSLGYAGYLLASHIKSLQRKDEHLQKEVIVF